VAGFEVFDFVLVSDHEARELREKNAKEPWQAGCNARTEGGLPVEQILRSETEYEKRPGDMDLRIHSNRRDLMHSLHHTR